ncbi:uncharacterized protein LOC130719518 [Lotus japonicus]|uniref:uncharacterized protein LOC130719518 n=1 Tax=Lotus japonicus TaxID=34305 RepID=UPI0025837363|nr:uncharacterized protein LOC130719518 [Lotus japonicus]
MGLKSSSSQPSTVSKKAPRKTKTRYPARKTYMSKVQNKEPTNVPLCEDVTDEEEIDTEKSLAKLPPDVVPDVETSGSKEISAKENPGKDSTSHEDSEPTQAPAPVQDISDDDSDDEPLVKSIPDSVAARMKRKRRVSTPEVTPTPPKRSKSSPVTYKSRQASVKDKGKQKAVRTPSEKKKRKIPIDVEESESDAEADDVIALIEKAGLMKTIQNVGRKLKVDALLLKLQEGERKGGEHSAAATAAQDESNEEEEGSEENAEESTEESGEDSSSED